MMLSTCCIQYVSQSGRSSSGHRTGKGQSSSQFPRREVLKNVLTIGQTAFISYTSKVMLKILHAKASALCKPRTFRSPSWVLKRKRNQRSNCQHSLHHRERNSKKIYLSFFDYTKAFDGINHNKLWKALKEMGIPDHLKCLLRNL